MEDYKNIRELLDEDSIQVGFGLYPDLYKDLGDQTLHDRDVLRLLHCDVFQTIVKDTDFLNGLDEDVLETTLMFQNITSNDGTQVDLFDCVGKKQAKKLISDYDLVKRLSRDSIVNMMNRKCCEFFDKQTTVVALKAHPGKFFKISVGSNSKKKYKFRKVFFNWWGMNLNSIKPWFFRRFFKREHAFGAS